MYVCAIVSLFLVVSGFSRGDAHLQNYLNTHFRLFGTLEHLLVHRSRYVDLIDNRLSNVLSDKYHSYDTLPLGRTAIASMVKVRRLAKDWSSLAAVVGRYTALSDLGLNGVRWPEQKEVEAAAKAVFRIQATYAESSNSLAQRNFSLSFSNSGLTALDCFNIALHFYNNAEAGTAEWLQLSLEKISNGDTSVPKQLVMFYKAALTCSSGDSLSSASVLSSMLKELPDYKVPASLLRDYQLIASRGCGGHEATTTIQLKEENETEEEQIIHKKLCKAPESLPDGLRCRYVHYQQPHLRFQPFKLEELRLDPPVLRFYDVITDREAEVFKNIFRQRMEKSKTVAVDGGIELSDYRTSHVAWIYPQENRVSDTLQRRIADITRINLTFAEPHQISRYGVGGEYKPHQDHFGMPITSYEYDRLATLMFYLNNVTHGGNTVFLDWKLTIAPVKNSAVLWFHFIPSGEEDLSSRHSGCPVIEGEKWVMNKWTHNIGNEFVLPCRLNKNGTYMDYYL